MSFNYLHDQVHGSFPSYYSDVDLDVFCDRFHDFANSLYYGKLASHSKIHLEQVDP